VFSINESWHPQKSKQYIFEVNYGLTVVPGITFRPYAQYVINPFDSSSPAGYRQVSSAVVVGLQASIDLANLFQWPQFIPH
jgi:carbohydrate-selective porin OprB